MNHKQRAASFISVLVLMTLIAPGVASAAAWTDLFTPTRVWFHKDYMLIDAKVAVEGCTTSWIRIARTQDNYSEVRAMVLLAKANGHKVKFFIGGCFDQGDGNTQMVPHTTQWIAIED